jgi:hypothetical protein
MTERRMAVRRQRMKERKGASGFLKEHLALVASGALVLLSVVRVYYFAALNPDVALTVLSVTNRTQVLVSTLLNVIVTLAPFVVFSQPLREWLFGGYRTGATYWVKLRTGLLWAPVMPVIISTFSATLLGAFVIGGILTWFSRWRLRKSIQRDPDASPKPSRFVWDRQWLAMLALGSLLAVTISIPWQPLEKLKLASSDSPVIGYIIGEQAGKTLIVDKQRKPIWTKSDDVTGRELCVKEQSWMNSSVTTLVFKMQNRQIGVECS